MNLEEKLAKIIELGMDAGNITSYVHITYELNGGVGRERACYKLAFIVSTKSAEVTAPTIEEAVDRALVVIVADLDKRIASAETMIASALTMSEKLGVQRRLIGQELAKPALVKVAEKAIALEEEHESP
jgi:hypothetical protein